jgi:hypothetical protein
MRGDDHRFIIFEAFNLTFKNINMPIKFKVRLKSNPADPKGPKTYRPRIEYGEKVTTDDLIEIITKGNKEERLRCTIFFINLRFAIANLIADGKVVRIDDLGTLYPVIKTTSDPNRKKVSEKNITAITMRFLPAVWMKKELNGKRGRVEGGSRGLTNEKYIIKD